MSPSASPKPGLAVYALFLFQHKLCKEICADFYSNKHMYLLKGIHLKYYSCSKYQDPFLLQQSQTEPKRDEKVYKSVGAPSSWLMLPRIGTHVAPCCISQ